MSLTTTSQTRTRLAALDKTAHLLQEDFRRKSDGTVAVLYSREKRRLFARAKKSMDQIIEDVESLRELLDQAEEML